MKKNKLLFIFIVLFILSINFISLAVNNNNFASIEGKVVKMKGVEDPDDSNKCDCPVASDAKCKCVMHPTN